MYGRYVLIAACVFGLLAGAAAFGDDGAAAQTSSDSAKASLAKPSEPGKPYTSVIIDTTGFDLQRCMSPKVRKPDGSEVWGTIKVDYDVVEEKGIVGYAVSLEDAKKNSRCGSNPLILQAVAIYGGKRDSDPVIAAEDAKLLLAENEKSHFLDNLNVIFLKCTKPASDDETK